MKLNSWLIYLVCSVSSIGLGFLLSLILSGSATSYYLMCTLGIIITAILVVHIVSSKLNVKLDINTYNTDERTSFILNDVFAGLLIAIPLSFFITLLF